MVDVNWIVWLMDLCRNVIENLAVQIGNAITHKDYSHQFDALQRTLREHHSNLLYTVPDTVTQGSFVLTKPFSLFAPTTKKTQRADIILVFSPVNEWLQAWNIHCNSYCFPSVYCCWVRCLQAEESRLAQKVLVDVIVRAPILEDPRNLLSFIHYFASYILLFLFFFFFAPGPKNGSRQERLFCIIEKVRVQVQVEESEVCPPLPLNCHSSLSVRGCCMQTY